MIGQTNKERGRQASTVRYRGVSILQPNPLAFEGRPNILSTWLPSLAGAHTRDITDARIHTFHKAQCTVLLVYSGNTSLVDTVEHNIQLSIWLTEQNPDKWSHRSKSDCRTHGAAEYTKYHMRNHY